MDSPLDPFQAKFLQFVQKDAAGYVPGPQAKRCADQLGMQTAFVEALYVSARMRGLLKPSYRQAGKIHWQVSDNGAALVERYAPPPGSQDDEPSASSTGSLEKNDAQGGQTSA